ncbi:hypothetical protein [Azospirillum griseum]|uniref:Uncharacterized protein n=1 Tax=Azospirillum griseum TaxID=2496639 RepID=A0A431VFL2_9PROT|nr:hypothetical protein [Azospirillum griseum]RTR18349.1 hypothetical protein EJ903_15965 [Azospirillum griseum]
MHQKSINTDFGYEYITVNNAQNEGSMTSANVYLNNDWPTAMNVTTSDNNIDGLIANDTNINGFSSTNFTVETTGIEQSWFAIGNGGAGWANFYLGSGAYKLGYNGSGNDPNFCFFEADTDIPVVSTLGIGSISNFHYCWGPQNVPPVINGVLSANLPSIISWINSGKISFDLGSVSITLNSISESASVNCYYGSLFPTSQNSAYARLMLCINNATIDATASIASTSFSISADPLYVYVGFQVNYPTNSEGTANPSITVDLFQVSTPGWSVSSSFVLEAILAIVLPGVGVAALSALTGSSAGNYVNGVLNAAIINAINNYISGALKNI